MQRRMCVCSTNLSPEHKEGPAHYDEGRYQNLHDEAAGDDTVSHITWRLPNHVPVHGLHPQTGEEWGGVRVRMGDGRWGKKNRA